MIGDQSEVRMDAPENTVKKGQTGKMTGDQRNGRKDETTRGGKATVKVTVLPRWRAAWRGLKN